MGVLQNVGGSGLDGQPEYVGFFHNLLQEFAVAWYISKEAEKDLNTKVIIPV